MSSVGISNFQLHTTAPRVGNNVSKIPTIEIDHWYLFTKQQSTSKFTPIKTVSAIYAPIMYMYYVQVLLLSIYSKMCKLNIGT